MGKVLRAKGFWVTLGIAAAVPVFMGYFGRELLAALILFSVAFVIFMAFAALLNGMHLAWSALRGRAESPSQGAPTFSKTLFHRPRLWLGQLLHWLRQTPETPSWLQSLRLFAAGLATRYSGIARVAFRHPR